MQKKVEIRIAALVIQLWRWAAEGSASARACATRFFPFPLSSQAWRPSTPPDNQEGGFPAQHARHTRADVPLRDHVAGAYPGVPLARDPARATWSRRRPCSRRSTPHPHPKSPRRPPRTRPGTQRKRRMTHATPQRTPSPPQRKPSLLVLVWRSQTPAKARANDDAHDPELAARGVSRATIAGSPKCALFRAPHTAHRRARRPRVCRCTAATGVFRDVSEQNDVES